MPETAAKIKEQIGASDISFESIKEFGGLADGTKVGEATPLFARIDAEKKLEEIEAEFAKENAVEIALTDAVSKVTEFVKANK